jgi:hypothetical protein
VDVEAPGLTTQGEGATIGSASGAGGSSAGGGTDSRASAQPWTWSTIELLDRGVEASEIMTFSPDDGGTFFGFSDPDGNSWAVQQLRIRGERPLIPLEHRGRFGA